MIENTVYKKRRKRLFGLMKDNSIVLIESAPEKIRNNDSTYRYRQCSNFYYLTGYNKPSALLVVLKKNKKLITHFFTKKPNKHDEVWTGQLPTSAKTKNLYGFDKCSYLNDIEKYLMTYLENIKTIYHAWDDDTVNKSIFDSCLHKLGGKYRSGTEIPSEFLFIKKDST